MRQLTQISQLHSSPADPLLDDHTARTRRFRIPFITRLLCFPLIPTLRDRTQPRRQYIRPATQRRSPTRQNTLPNMSSSAPTVARVSSVGQWSNLFHPHNGVFRLPRTEGASIEHLDIDLRFVDHETAIRSGTSTPSPNGPMSGDIYLPNVAVITLRGAEHVQDHDGRMDALADVLLATRPIEVRW